MEKNNELATAIVVRLGSPSASRKRMQSLIFTTGANRCFGAKATACLEGSQATLAFTPSTHCHKIAFPRFTQNLRLFSSLQPRAEFRTEWRRGSTCLYGRLSAQPYSIYSIQPQAHHLWGYRIQNWLLSGGWWILYSSQRVTNAWFFMSEGDSDILKLPKSSVVGSVFLYHRLMFVVTLSHQQRIFYFLRPSSYILRTFCTVYIC